MRQAFSRIICWLGGHDLAVLGSLLIVTGGTWAFLEIADEVQEGDIQHLDENILRAFRNPDNPAQPIGPPWVAEMARDVTALGGYALLGLLVGAVAGFLFLEGKHHAMWLLLAAVFSGYLVMMALKTLFDRPRPDIVPHLSYVLTASFPSGHSMMSAVVFLTLGALLARMALTLQLKFYFLSVAVFLSFIVGVTRVYLGVHYPSDVLAGWTGGLVWSSLCSLVARFLQRRGQIEKGL